MSDTDRSHRFDPAIIKRALRQEDIWIDVKVQMYKLTSDEAKGEFARDLIAFANVARRTGRNCYIVFGIEDDTREIVPGLEHQYPGKNPPKGWNNPRVSLADKMTNGVDKVLHEIASDWVSPSPDFGLEWGWIDGKFVSYLEIRPTASDEPFALRRSFTKKHKNTQVTYQRGDKFIRYGSSTKLVTREFEHLLVPIRKVPYLSPEEWHKILEGYREEPFSQAYDWVQSRFPLYEEHGEKALDLLLKAIQDGNHAVIRVSGGAGVGKSMLLRALSYALAEQVVWPKSGFPTPVPHGFIPLHMEVRGQYFNRDDFEAKLRLLFQQKDAQFPVRNYFLIPETQWVLLLDGLDEIYSWEHVLPWLQDWVKQLPPSVRVVLSARPYIWPEKEHSPVFTIRALGPDEARQLFLARVQDLYRDALEDEQLTLEGVALWAEQELWENLIQQNEMLLPLLTRPRSIDAVLYHLQIAKDGDESLLADLEFSELGSEETSTEKTVEGSDFAVGLEAKTEAQADSYVGEEILAGFEMEDVVDTGQEEVSPTLEIFAEGKEEVVWPSPPLLAFLVVSYLWEQEVQKYAGSWGVWQTREQEAIRSRERIASLAWDLDWREERLRWPNERAWEVVRFYGERVGVLEPERGAFCERFSSLPMRWVETAYGGWKREKKVRRWLKLARSLAVAPQHGQRILEILNAILVDNGRAPLLSQEWERWLARIVGRFAFVNPARNTC